MNLEVNRAFADADQRLATVLNALKVGAVASNTSNVVKLLALLNHCGFILLSSSRLCIRGQSISEEARAGEGESHSHNAGGSTAHLAAAL